MAKAARARTDTAALAQLEAIDARLSEFGRFLSGVRRRRKPLAESTVQVYLTTVRRMLKEERESVEVERMAFDPQGWLEAQIGPRTPRGTASSILPAVKHFLEWARAVRLLAQENPPRPLPYLGGLPEGTREALDEEDYERFAQLVADSDIRDPSYTILLLLPECGLRIEEVCTLELGHLSVQGRGKGRRLGFSILGKGGLVRWVPLTERGVELLNEFRPELKLALHRAPPALEPGPLFPSPRGGGTKPNTVRKHLRAERQGWEGLDAIAPHILRHTFATRLVRKNVPMPVIQRFMGHKSPKTTDRYIQPSVDDYAKAIDKLDDEDED